MSDGPSRGESFDFGLVLIGRGLGYFPYFLFTFRELGKNGLGPGRGQFLAEASVVGEAAAASFIPKRRACCGRGRSPTPFTAATMPAGPSGRRLAVHFLTPTRIRQDGGVLAELTFQDLARALLRRLSSLCYFHCGQELSVDFKGLIAQAATVRGGAVGP